MRLTAHLLALLVAATGARSEEPAGAMTRGKLAADLGRHADAAAIFAALAGSPDASPEQRWEARVRLGASLRESGDPEGSRRASSTCRGIRLSTSSRTSTVSRGAAKGTCCP